MVGVMGSAVIGSDSLYYFYHFIPSSVLFKPPIPSPIPFTPAEPHVKLYNLGNTIYNTIYHSDLDKTVLQYNTIYNI